ncbi:MAG: BamA/TamA family outer membrane protein [bacterium]|nr:BamA/TamA family outer membrane protein [bacterium]
MHRVRACVAACALLLFLPALPGLAQEEPSSERPVAERPARDRPTIGIALSGGGAKGLAHVGVLKVFEEMRIPIDYIGGTSMGAIAGGLYAAGLSADELEEAVLTIDWQDVLDDAPSRDDLSYRRKSDDLRYLANLELGFKDGKIRFPGGLNTGQKLMFLLQSYTLEVAGVQDFDDLPIPFRAVATDIETGDMVVLGDGDLAYSLRASMAIPAYFSPVELGGKLLVDGAAANNIPVDVVKDMGPDVVIAIDISAQLATRDKLDSFVAVLSQNMGLQNRKNMEPRLAMADLVITPEVTSFGVLEFKSGTEIIALGVEKARAHAEDLQPYVLDEEAYREHLEARPKPEATPETIDEIRFVGNVRVDDRIIANKLRADAGGPLDLEALSADLERVYGLGDFELIDFDLVQEDEQNVVVIRTQEKPWGPTYLRAGLFLESDLESESSFAVLFNLTMTRLNARGAEWRNDLRIGQNRLIATELYQPLDFRGGWFVAASLEWRRRNRDFFSDGQELGEFEVRRATATLDFGHQFGRFGEVRLGLERGTATIDVQSGIPPPGVAIELDDIDFGAVVFEGAYDRLDSSGIPRRGAFGRLRGFLATEDLGGGDDYDKWEVQTARFFTRGRHTFVGSLEGGWSPGGELPVYDEFTLGGFLSLSGFKEEQLRGQYFGVARIGYYYRLFGKFYAGGWLETGNVWQSSDDLGDDLIETSTLFLGAETLAGPLYLAYGVAEDGNDRFYLSIGKNF